MADEVAAPKPLPHLVFAHYMLCFFSDVDFYKREIELAQHHGIDGFALNAGEWTGTNYVPAAERMYQAAAELNTGFKIFISADCTGTAGRRANMEDMVKRFASHPNQLQYDGKTVLSTWAGSPQGFEGTMAKIKADGLPVFFVPCILQSPFPNNWSERMVRDLFEGASPLDGFFWFGADMTPGELIRTNANARRATLELGKLYMAGNSPAYNSANLRDFIGTRGYQAVWEGIVHDSADWAEVVTWNDYNEDSNLMPYRWGGEKAYWSRDESFLDITGYYANWFKSGIRPEITQDKIYYTYRNRSRFLTQAWDLKLNKWVDITKEGGSSGLVDQIHDDVADNIYVSTFLTAPAELSVSIGGSEYKFNQPAGTGYASVPMSPGVPHFELHRSGQLLISVDGRKEIIGEVTKENSLSGSHLPNRTWTGGAAAGPITRLEAASAQLDGTASRQDNGILIPTEKNSGLTFPLSGQKTATYNVRVIYRNPSKTEARLTLTGDGPPFEKSTPPYSFPLFLPPTGTGEKTSSFLWTLYDKSTKLSVKCEMPDHVDPTIPWEADTGGVVIEAIELVAVNPVPVVEPQALGLPPLVAIPGGTFIMGSETGASDEKPVRHVTLSPFAMGKYEITNEEYERFDPKHRQWRDGYSWRDSDPVIYVSWTDAVKYCNWLSGQAGLIPAYDEKDWTIKPNSDGYRLPSEAQWEYVASGRGEGRMYPWGNETPTPDRGNFSLEQSLDLDAALHGQGVQNVTPVGSYEKGSSKDGVMDLAGNVSEWCADIYDNYPIEAGNDPVVDATNPRYRAIRGGSWGYYNYSQKVTHREFNSPHYAGFIYIGFRVALPQAGWEKVQNKL